MTLEHLPHKLICTATALEHFPQGEIMTTHNPHIEADIKSLAEAVQTLFENADAEVPCAVFDILTRDEPSDPDGEADFGELHRWLEK